MNYELKVIEILKQVILYQIYFFILFLIERNLLHYNQFLKIIRLNNAITIFETRN